MNRSVEDKKEEIKEKLENELYVGRYETFKESIELINKALDDFDINYQYTYDNFCNDFTNECLKYIDENPNVDMGDPKQMMTYTLPIIMRIVNDKRNKYGAKS